MDIARGQRLKMADVLGDACRFTVVPSIVAPDMVIDFSIFGIDTNGKLAGDEYLCFFNSPTTPCGAVHLSSTVGQTTFAMELSKLPARIDRLVLTASIDGSGTMARINGGFVRIDVAGISKVHFPFSGSDFAAERALILGEFYRKDGIWRFSATAQGFNGGLDALITHFGGEVAAAPTPAPTTDTRVNLEKRVAQEAPQLVNLVKTAKVSLEKVGLSDHRAKVALCLDISGSMGTLYRSGKIQAFAERILALGCRFDDDGEIDVFLFGADVHQPEPMGLGNATAYVRNLLDRYKLEGDTRYGLAIQAIRRFYFPQNGGTECKTPTRAALPVYVMFLTDGATSDKPFTQKQLRWASHEPIFWQFIGIGKSSKSKKKFDLNPFKPEFEFLEKLDTLDGRLIDNAGFFSVMAPDEHPDATLYDHLMGEYPQWVGLAKAKGLIG